MNETNNNNGINNGIFYGLLTLFFIFIAYAIYIYSTSVILSKKDYKENYIKVDDVEFNNLPSYIQSEYIKKYECPTKKVVEKVIDNSLIEQLQNENKKLKEKLLIQPTKIITKTKIKNIPVIKKETVIIKEDIFNTSKYDVAKCYNMAKGSDQLTKKCTKNIFNFINKHKNAKYFEVIGVLSRDDFLILKKLKKNLDVLEKLNVTTAKIKKLEKYSDIGLSQKRVEETIWFIKQTLGKDTIALPVNYTITSKYHNRGTVVRAYY